MPPPGREDLGVMMVVMLHTNGKRFHLEASIASCGGDSLSANSLIIWPLIPGWPAASLPLSHCAGRGETCGPLVKDSYDQSVLNLVIKKSFDDEPHSGGVDKSPES